MAKKLKLLVCTKSHCKKRGSKKMMRSLEEQVQDLNLEDVVCIKKSSCLGKCGRGPVAKVKALNLFYGHLQPVDSEDIVRSLKKKKVVKKFLLA